MLRCPVTQPVGADVRVLGGVATTAAVATPAFAWADAAITRAVADRAPTAKSRRVQAIMAQSFADSSGAPGVVLAASSSEVNRCTGVVTLGADVIDDVRVGAAAAGAVIRTGVTVGSGVEPAGSAVELRRADAMGVTGAAEAEPCAAGCRDAGLRAIAALLAARRAG